MSEPLKKPARQPESYDPRDVPEMKQVLEESA